MKNIFTIDPTAPFLDVLASELWQRTEGDGFRLSHYLILLPTRRACRHLGTVFAKLAKDKPVLLPRMRPLGDSDEEEMIFTDASTVEIPPAIAPLKRLMLLTQQVQRRDPTLSLDQAAQAAEALTGFLDQIQIEQCDLSKLPELVIEQELAEHWQQTIHFLEIVTKNWPTLLAAHGSIDPAQRRNAVLAAQAALWRDHPPKFPVIAAGSTGSVLATAHLLDIIASQPSGAVILPGLDRTIDNEAWDAIDDTHPQYSMKKLLDKMGVKRQSVANWGEASSPTLPRYKLLSEAMRPAALTEHWRSLRGSLTAEAVSGITHLTLDHPQEEAQVIALRLRAFLETPEKTAAFVTADRSLAVRVASLLRRWGIEVDDSGGVPLAMSPLGTFLNLVLAAASPYAGTVDYLALLKHPFAACGMFPAACRTQAREAEIRVRKFEAEEFRQLKHLLIPLSDHWNQSASLEEHIAAHIAVAEAIAATNAENGAQRLWGGEAGEATAAWFDEWHEGADNFPNVSGNDYTALFGSLAAMKTLRSTAPTHPHLSILGPLEARLIDADLIVLGGMNEGVWPPDAGFDPWMSRPMRKKFKLPSPEFRIGLSAHDFVQLACAKQVMLTRSLRSGGSPTVPSRFLLQLEAVLRAAGLPDDILKPDHEWQEWAKLLDAPAETEKAPCPRPQPTPPLSARPTTLSVTEISTWRRNPYAIYAKHVLKLKKLDELDMELDASDRGEMIHKALERFVREFPDRLPPDAEAQLLTIGQEIFAHDKGNPRVRVFWWSKFTEIAAGFITLEHARRDAGIQFIAAELQGKIIVDGLTLKGRADRIDRLAEGSLSIIDYKTGVTPSKTDVEAGLEPQLQLLALIAASGGFPDIAAGQSGALEYWSLKGGTDGCKPVPIKPEKIPVLIEQAEEGLKNLIATFDDPATPYEATPKPRLQPRYNDYAHLSRLAEWGRTGEKS